MCIASVSDCRALAAAHPVDVTRARIPWFISSHAGRGKEQQMERELRPIRIVQINRRSKGSKLPVNKLV